LDVISDLSTEDFGSALSRLSELGANQLQVRRDRLEAIDKKDAVDPYISSPCLFCLDTFGKLPWRDSFAEKESRALPVLQSL